jgi:flagellar motor switch protein FliN/FliY
MSADALSQEEIDALLKGSPGGTDSSESGSMGPPPQISARQIQGITRYSEMMASTLGDMIGTFLAAPAFFEPQKPLPQNPSGAAGQIIGAVVTGSFSYGAGLSGASALVFKQQDACRIGGTMVGDPAASEFGDMVADAFKEVLSTVLGNLNTGLGKPLGASVSNSQASMESGESSPGLLVAALGGEDQMVLVPFEMTVGDAPPSKCWQLLSLDLVNSVEALVAPPPSAAKPSSREAAPTVRAAPVEFDSLTDEAQSAVPNNLNLIMDIGLEIRVELGRSHLKIRDVLKLGNGSVVELDKLAGEPVDLLVNDVIFAKGEVVVIDENFGVRITDILSLDERIKTLGDRKD